jgi:hypothetical protein
MLQNKSWSYIQKSVNFLQGSFVGYAFKKASQFQQTVRRAPTNVSAEMLHD